MVVLDLVVVNLEELEERVALDVEKTVELETVDEILALMVVNLEELELGKTVGFEVVTMVGKTVDFELKFEERVNI